MPSGRFFYLDRFIGLKILRPGGVSIAFRAILLFRPAAADAASGCYITVSIAFRAILLFRLDLGITTHLHSDAKVSIAFRAILLFRHDPVEQIGCAEGSLMFQSPSGRFFYLDSARHAGCHCGLGFQSPSGRFFYLDASQSRRRTGIHGRFNRLQGDSSI